MSKDQSNVSTGYRLLEALTRPLGSGVGINELAVFYRQFSGLMSAGIPLIQSLATLQTTAPNNKLKEVIKDCHRRLEKGSPLTTAFAAHR